MISHLYYLMTSLEPPKYSYFHQSFQSLLLSIGRNFCEAKLLLKNWNPHQKIRRMTVVWELYSKIDYQRFNIPYHPNSATIHHFTKEFHRFIIFMTKWMSVPLLKLFHLPKHLKSNVPYCQYFRWGFQIFRWRYRAAFDTSRRVSSQEEAIYLSKGMRINFSNVTKRKEGDFIVG